VFLQMGSSQLLNLGAYAALVELFPMAAYAVRAPDGVIVWFNSRAAQLWGRVPTAGETDERFCGAYKLYRADGTPMSHCDTPVAEVLETGIPVHRQEAVIERPDGSRVTVSVNIDPIRGEHGEVVGVVNFFSDTSERKHAEQTTALLAAIVDWSDDAIISKNLDGMITSWNKGAERLFGFTAQEVIGRNITLIIPPARRNEEAAILERLRRGERVDHFETVRLRKDKTPLDVSLSISPVKAADGTIVGASKVARDIGERKRSERALAEQARLLDLSSDAIFVRDEADRITYWNKAAAKMYGYSREEALGRVPHELLRTEFPAPLENIQHLLHKETFWTGELVHRTKGGDRLVVMTRWVLDPKSYINSWAVLETNTDITQSKRIEDALRESEERFRAIVETTPECVKLVADDGKLLFMNSPGLAMVGAACAEMVVGKSIYDVIANEDRDRFRAFNEEVCRGGKRRLEFDIVGLDGTRRHMETHGAPLRNPDGTIVQLAVTRDITLRQKAEESRKEAEVSALLLQVQDQERKRIARELHDGVGQLIAAANMNNAVVEKEKDRLSTEAAQRVADNVALIEQISSGIRTVSYLLHPPLLDELGLESALRWYVEGFAERSGITAKLEAADLPRLHHDHELCLFRIAQEALTNVHRHSGSSRVLVKLSHGGREIKMEVVDEGRGIPLDAQAKIASGASTGVGLRGMQERVKQLGGILRVHSDSNGTSIVATLPIVESAIAPEAKSGDTPAAQHTQLA
jgi:PAS domain S-box-containing protein